MSTRDGLFAPDGWVYWQALEGRWLARPLRGAKGLEDFLPGAVGGTYDLAALVKQRLALRRTVSVWERSG